MKPHTRRYWIKLNLLCAQLIVAEQVAANEHKRDLVYRRVAERTVREADERLHLFIALYARTNYFGELGREVSCGWCTCFSCTASSPTQEEMTTLRGAEV